MWVRVVITLLMLMVFFRGESFGNETEGTPADSVVYAYLPYVKFDSDIGFEGGLVLDRFHYEEELRPFRNLSMLRLNVSTLGLFRSRLVWENMQPVFTGLRTRFEFIGERMLNDIYFPRGNSSEFNRERWDEDYYFFDALGFEAMYEGRYPMRTQDPDRHFDILLLGGGIAREEFSTTEGNSIEEHLPMGYDGGWYVYTGTGVIYDTRENEFDPRQGSFTRAELTGSPGIIGSYGMMRFEGETSYYYSPSFAESFTLAGRLRTAWTAGDVPFWMLPEVGGEESVRGYPTGRFRDNGMILTNIEARTWLLALDFLQLRAGFTAFSDSGRVFSSFPEGSEWVTDYNRTYGGGPIVSAFTRDFILRAQVGWSDELMRIYMNIGFSF